MFEYSLYLILQYLGMKGHDPRPDDLRKRPLLDRFPLGGIADNDYARLARHAFRGKTPHGLDPFRLSPAFSRTLDLMAQAKNKTTATEASVQAFIDKQLSEAARAGTAPHWRGDDGACYR